MKSGVGYLTKRKQRKVIRFCRFDVNKDPDNFFRELVMLFNPWRDEFSEVENQNCEEIYKGNKQNIEALYKMYNSTDIDFNKILSELEERREFEMQDDEDNVDEEVEPTMACYDFIDDTIQPNIMVDIGQEAPGDNVKTFTVPDLMPNDEYFELCNSLNLKQRDYLMHTVNEMKATGDPFYHFISGGAGVGKSRLIKAIYQSIVRFSRQIPGPVELGEVVLIAPTGKAAHNIGGMTAHSAFFLPVTQGQASIKDLLAESLNTLQVKLNNMKLLIIDEISMMGSNQFANIHRRMKQIFRSDKPFGGKSVIVFGDFNQLRPVGDSYVFIPRKDPLASLVGNYLWQNFQLFELTEIMRQRDDLMFAEALGRLAKGMLTNDDTAMFKRRCFEIHENLPEEAKRAIHLFKTKAEVEQYNLKRVQELTNPDTEKINFKAIDKVVGASNLTDSKQALHALQKMPTDQTYGLPSTISLQKDVRYMVTVNINISDGLFNGASGVLKFVEISRHMPHAVWIEFDDPVVGSSARGDRKNVSEMLKLPLNWTPIQRTKKTFKTTKSGQAQICREQYPLIVAEGITIHKSQGQSMERVVVGLAKSMDRSLLYVALSRATSLNGLFMIGDFKPPHTPPHNYPPLAEMARMKLYATLSPKFVWMQHVQDNAIQIISHNVQSLRKHLQSITCDPVYLNSHLLLFQETWLVGNENCVIQGFKEVQRNYIGGRPAANGTIIYIKESFDSTADSSMIRKSGDQHIEITSCYINDVKIVNIYKNPTSTVHFLKTTILEKVDLFEHNNILLCGDFNTDFKKSTELENFLQSRFGLNLLSPKQPTTNGGTTIDAVFGRLETYVNHTSIYESLFSYHKPLVTRLYKKS